MTGNPYPGLRPFQEADASLFFGREKQVKDLLALLGSHRFLAVVGVSGSGKSSLVKAGLIPALHLGAMGEEFADWRVATLRPGTDPIGELCRALSGKDALGPDPDCRATLESSSRGLIERVLRASLEDGSHLLVVVDQFEELFRYSRAHAEGPDQAARFVGLLLEASRNAWARIYVLLTMRSDFLGECAQFHDLPETLTGCQYLVPRMTRDERREAIEKPARANGCGIEAGLVERLLNEPGEEAGRLPVLQHALNRTFHEFRAGGGAGEIGGDAYKAAGEFQDALNRHADAVLESLRQQGAEPWAGKVFRCLTAVESGRRVRRPAKLDLLYRVVGAEGEPQRELVRKVVKTYSDPEHSMLVWSGKELTGESVIDLSHESLIERWTRLKRWVGDEAEAVRVYRAAADDAIRATRGAAAAWRGVKLEEALDYIGQGAWNEAWAGQLVDREALAGELPPEDRLPPFADVKKFIEREAAAQQKEERQKKRRAAATVFLLSAVLVLGGMVGFYRLRQAESERKGAESARALLELRNSEAKLRQQIAASDDLLNQYKKKEQELEDQIAKAGQSEEVKNLRAELDKLRNQKNQIQAQKNGAEAKLSADSKSQTRVNPVDGLTYVFIPAGAFTMGCSPGDTECFNDEKPAHAVQIANGFWLGQTEVTQAAWKKVMNGQNPSYFKSDQLPVDSVTWTEAANYCKAVNGRLPTEAEWEYAARAGTMGPRYGDLDSVAWDYANSGGTTHPAALKQPNAFGLYDMLGNVWEWVENDWAAYPGGSVDACPGCKVLRGGSWLAIPRSVRVSNRVRVVPGDRFFYIGFRCVGEFR